MQHHAVRHSCITFASSQSATPENILHGLVSKLRGRFERGLQPVPSCLCKELSNLHLHLPIHCSTLWPLKRTMRKHVGAPPWPPGLDLDSDLGGKCLDRRSSRYLPIDGSRTIEQRHRRMTFQMWTISQLQQATCHCLFFWATPLAMLTFSHDLLQFAWRSPKDDWLQGLDRQWIEEGGDHEQIQYTGGEGASAAVRLGQIKFPPCTPTDQQYRYYQAMWCAFVKARVDRAMGAVYVMLYESYHYPVCRHRRRPKTWRCCPSLQTLRNNYAR